MLTSISTKNKILDASLHLFNTHGVESISLKTIAKEMGISDGNLRYYFKTKDALILAHFYELDNEIDSLNFDVQPEDFNLNMLYIGGKIAFESMNKYRYLLIDLVSLCRKVEGFKAAFDSLYGRRYLTFQALFYFMNAKGLLEAEIFPGHYQQLFRQFFLIANFWLSEAEVNHLEPGTNKLNYFCKLAFDLFVPLLTEEGMKQYKEIKFD